MLDDCIDAKGTVKDLRAQGILDHIAQDSTADVKEEEPVAAIKAPRRLQNQRKSLESLSKTSTGRRQMIKL
jgi:hypothetical protein